MPDLSHMDEAEFTAAATQFLEANASLKAEEKAFVWGEGDDDASLFDDPDREAELVELAHAKAWRAKKYDAGFGWISGPVELGGSGCPRSHERIWSRLESQYDVPSTGFFGIGLGMVAPTIAAHASPEVAADLLPKMYRGDLVGCQLFSDGGPYEVGLAQRQVGIGLAQRGDDVVAQAGLVDTRLRGHPYDHVAIGTEVLHGAVLESGVHELPADRFGIDRFRESHLHQRAAGEI